MKQVSLNHAQPVQDFNFDAKVFAQPSCKLLHQSFHNREQILQKCEQRRDELRFRYNFNVKPFQGLSSHLKQVLDTAKVKIVRTIYYQLHTKLDRLRKIAHYNLDLGGKQFRSAILLLLVQSILSSRYPDEFPAQISAQQALDKLKRKRPELYDKTIIFAAAIEVVHNASLLQDDIIDGAENRRSKEAAYKLYGESETLFTSTFLIGRGSHALALLDSPHLSQIYATIAKNLVDGQHIQAKKTKNFENLAAVFREYTLKSYYKTASMIALGCRGIGLLLDCSLQDQQNLFDFGAHLGIAFQIRDDLLDFTMDEQVLGKPSHQDIQQGLVTAPTIYSIAELQQSSDKNELIQLLKQKINTKEQIRRAIQIIHQQTSGLVMTELLIVEQLNCALQSLDRLQIKQSNTLSALHGLCKLVEARNK